MATRSAPDPITLPSVAPAPNPSGRSAPAGTARVVAARTASELEIVVGLEEAEVDREAERQQAIDPVRGRPLREVRLLVAAEEEWIGRGADQHAARLAARGATSASVRLGIVHVLEDVEGAHDVEATRPRTADRSVIPRSTRPPDPGAS